MAIRLGEIAPNFTANTTQGPIHFHEWLGESWGLFFSHPADFTPVCTTELGRTASLKDAFDERNVKAIALSVDSLQSHKAWIRDIEETQNVMMNFPIIEDHTRKISIMYDMIHPAMETKTTVRTVFIIDPNKKVRLTLTYPPATGRNFYEILRVIDSLQLTENHSVATPADWHRGEDVVISPSISDEKAREKFNGNIRMIKPYLRMTPQPQSTSNSNINLQVTNRINK